jgi:hypothetical protein
MKSPRVVVQCQTGTAVIDENVTAITAGPSPYDSRHLCDICRNGTFDTFTFEDAASRDEFLERASTALLHLLWKEANPTPR